jgi:hypothetical protein
VVERLDEAMAPLVAAAGKGARAVVHAARITEARRAIGAAHLERLAEQTDGLPVLTVPELFTRATGRRVVALVADALEPQIHGEAG